LSRGSAHALLRIKQFLEFPVALALDIAHGAHELDPDTATKEER
jgi:hypothetical protein